MNTLQKYSTSIRNWPKEDRPREKLLKKGEHTLNNSELLAILLRTGIKGTSALDLSRAILTKFKTFRNMSHVDLREWKEFKGIGKAKLAQIKAALEIARRFNNIEESDKKSAVKSIKDIVEMFKPRMRDLKNEVVKIIFLDVKNRIINIQEVDQGTPTSSNPIIREIISKALQYYAPSIVCIHNHPAGDANPSNEDILFTNDLKKSAQLLDIKLMDHIIFGESEYYSFDQKAISRY